jgi:hypothetical protein
MWIRKKDNISTCYYNLFMALKISHIVVDDNMYYIYCGRAVSSSVGDDELHVSGFVYKKSTVNGVIEHLEAKLDRKKRKFDDYVKELEILRSTENPHNKYYIDGCKLHIDRSEYTFRLEVDGKIPYGTTLVGSSIEDVLISIIGSLSSVENGEREYVMHYRANWLEDKIFCTEYIIHGIKEIIASLRASV